MRIPKVESLIITIFFLCVALWAISKCASKRDKIIQKAQDAMGDEERPVKKDTVYVPQPTPQVQTTSAPQTYSTPAATTPNTGGGLPKLQNQPVNPPSSTIVPGTQPASTGTTQNPPSTATSAKYSTLFVTIDGLKMRKEPSLKSDVVTRLDLYEQVYFLNKKSEKPEEISLGYEKVTDYWVKVRTKAGKEGWVFGAGVHYYKMKRKGVLE